MGLSAAGVQVLVKRKKKSYALTWTENLELDVSCILMHQVVLHKLYTPISYP